MDLRELLKNKNIDSKILSILENVLVNKPTIEEAIEISLKYKIPLHPEYLFYWNEISVVTFIDLLDYLINIKLEGLKGEIFFDETFKKTLEKIGIEHSVATKELGKVKNEKWAKVLVFSEETIKALLANFNITNFKEEVKERFVSNIKRLKDMCKKNMELKVTEILSQFCDYEIRDKGGTYIGARMGRPEKAKMRKLDGKPYGLFPVGEEGGRMRNLIEAWQKQGAVTSDFAVYYCENCKEETIYRVCDRCGKRTKELYFNKFSGKEVSKEHQNAVRYKKLVLDIERYINNVRAITGLREIPKLVKGVRGTSNRDHIVEHLVKAFLRAKNSVFVNKDGTVRYDMTEMGITHFKPKEIGTSVKRLIELGYEKDYFGKELVSEDQIVEIFPQDVILPDCELSEDEKASEFIIRTGNFVDDLLEYLYGLPRYYNFKTKEDTLGHLIIGLAPHTSAGIIGRIIGYSKTQGCFSHPMWHAAQRRNLDGDENGIILLLDALINFSREYLPDKRGSRTMDAPLVLTSHLYPDQIDDEVHGMDIVKYYPLELYKAAKEYKSPKEVKIEKVGSRIYRKDDFRYLGMFFTHDTEDFNDTITVSSYKSIPSMSEKVEKQLRLAEMIRAVKENEVASLLIDKHFMKDIKGNLRKFSMQTFRCTNCNEKYRRPPLNGKCRVCGKSSINFTISEGFIKKYLTPSFKLIERYEVDPYIKETLELVNLRVEGVFGKEEEKQKTLDKWFG